MQEGALNSSQSHILKSARPFRTAFRQSAADLAKSLVAEMCVRKGISMACSSSSLEVLASSSSSVGANFCASSRVC